MQTMREPKARRRTWPEGGGFTTGLAAGLVALVAAAALAWGWVRLRNELVALDVSIETQWKQVENQLLRQHDLIPNLVEVTRGYAEHERETLLGIAAARSRLVTGSAQQRLEAATALDGALSRLLAVAEAYPRLEADRQFRDLQFELSGTQNRVALERKRYNELVGLYNARLRSYPWRLAATGFEKRAFFSPPADRLHTPAIDL